MKKLNLNYFLCLLSLAVLFTACDKEEDEDPFLVTQSQIDAANNFIYSATGGDAAHAQGREPDSTFREIYSATKPIPSDLAKGIVFTKNVYNATSDGKKGDTLLVSFAMVKREAGYYAEGGDWEYIVLTADDSYPFGALPAEGEQNRGKLASCADCHSGAGGDDYLFAND